MSLIGRTVKVQYVCEADAPHEGRYTLAQDGAYTGTIQCEGVPVGHVQLSVDVPGGPVIVTVSETDLAAVGCVADSGGSGG